MADRNAEIGRLNRRLTFLEQEVSELRAALARLAAAEESPEAPARSVSTVTAQPAMRTSADSEPPAAATPPDDGHVHHRQRSDAVANAATEWSPRHDDRAASKVVATVPSAPGLFSTAADRIDALVALLLGPFGTLLKQVTSVYRHYRAQGKAAVFLLTVTGLVAFTAGFGYLLQYSFNSLLGPIAKLAIGFLSGAAIISLGSFLFRRNPRMQDYASSIIGLGVVVLYLCAYFTGPTTG